MTCSIGFTTIAQEEIFVIITKIAHRAYHLVDLKEVNYLSGCVPMVYFFATDLNMKTLNAYYHLPMNGNINNISTYRFISDKRVIGQQVLLIV